MLKCIPKPTPDKVGEAVCRWEREESSRLFVLVGETPISRPLVDSIYGEYKEISPVETLDVILDSNGGDIEAAYQLILFLREKSKKLRVFVPDWAKSAATFLCLGADEIWMNRTAELGPLDAQIPDPRNPDTPMSALEEFQAIDYLRQAAFQALDQLVMLLIRRTRMRLRDVLSEARQFATQLMEPLYSQVDPLLFGEAHRALEMSVQYGKRVMMRYSYKEWDEERTTEVLTKLTWGYPSHSFVIDYEEAKGLCLKVSLLEGGREDDAYAIIEGMDECIGFLASEVTSPTTMLAPAGKEVVQSRSESDETEEDKQHET